MKSALLLLLLSSALFATQLTFVPLEKGEESQGYRFFLGSRPVALVTVSNAGWVTYQSGRIPDGKAVYTNENGVRMAVWPFRMGVASGTYKEFSLDGDVIKIINYQNGQRHGVYKELWDDGSLHIVANYLKGRLNGSYREFDEDDTLIREDEYQNGVLHKNLYFLENLYKGNK